MIRHLKPYPAYKDSGVPWLGKVPEHWGVRRLRNVAEMRVSNVDKHTKDGEQPVRLCNYVDVYKNDRIRAEMTFMRATASSDEIEQFRLQPGDVLITKDSEAWDDIGVPAIVESSAPDLISGYHLALLHPKQAVGAFLFRALQSRRVAYQFHIEAKGVTRYGLSHHAIKSAWLPLPPLSEQTAIVRFLDYMDRRIRRVIRLRNQRIKLLEEYKQALINQAVTGKIDVRRGKPYPKYKHSGVEWLGEVPEDWELKPLKRWVRINASVLPDTTPADYEFRYLDVGTVGTGLLTGEPQRLRFSNAPSRARRVLHIGDTIISTVRTYLKAVYYADVDADALVCSTGFAVLTPGPSTQPKYVSYLVQSNTFTDRVTAESVGTAYPAISEERLGSFYVPIPPLHEQTAIVEFLDAQTAKIDAAVAAARREIDLLKEFRTRLVADVVTGKLDVRGAAQLPDEPPKEETSEDDEAQLSTGDWDAVEESVASEQGGSNGR